MKTTRLMMTAIGTAAVLLAAGCNSNNPPKVHGENFVAADAPRSYSNFTHAQAVAGATGNATLYTQEFTGESLNSLGICKLDLMLDGYDGATPMHVYLQMAEDVASPRETAVTEYLKSAGLTDGQIQYTVGMNPDTLAPTGYTINKIYKGDNGSMNGVDADVPLPGDTSQDSATTK